MKKKLLITSYLFFALLISNNAIAQLSEGGKPVSFDKHFQPSKMVPFETMPAFDLNVLRSEDAVNDQSKGPFRFGYNHLVNYNFSNSGTWTTLENGDRLWQLGIKSTGALSLNLAFDNFYLPEGAKLFVFTADKQFVIGAFTSKNNDVSNKFATDLLPGDALVIEYYEPVMVANQGHLNLFRVTHGYRGVEEYAAKALETFGQAGSCQVNVNCPLGLNWQNEKRGVVCLVVGGSEFCSGSLINDVPQNLKPYVLTANHCSSSNDFATWVFRFNWEAPSCNNPTTSPSTAQSLSTSALKARSGGSDFCLVEITGGLSNGTVPATYTPYFNGWSNINTAATSVIAIHHPSGDIKKISQALNATSTGTYNSADCWKIGQWTTACTEPGSSGSPLFDQNKRIVGQLFGGPSSCSATTSNLYDYYGKFATSWLGGGDSTTQLKHWLDPDSTGATTLDGFDPNAIPPAFAFDAGIQSIIAPTTGDSTCNTSVIPQVVLHNYGSSTLTSCNINYKLDAGTVQTYNWSGSLSTNVSTLITLPAINGLTVASHSFTSYSTNPNDSTDQHSPNDSSSVSFLIISPAPVAVLPQFESFESTFPSSNWSLGNPNTNDTWTKVTTAGGYGNSTSSARMNNNATNDITGQSDFIYSPYLNLSSVTGPITLMFDVAYARYSATYKDSLFVSVSGNCGATWDRLYAKGGTALATAPDNTGSFVPTASQWRTESINLNNYAGQSSLRVAFENKSGYGQAVYIDNINISNSGLSVSNTDLNSSFNIYPNPSNGEFNVAIHLLAATDVTVKVMNVLGSIVSTKVLSNISTGVYNVDLSKEAEGIYFIELSTATEKSVKKISVLKN
jgi:lysyl endopeptidase